MDTDTRKKTAEELPEILALSASGRDSNNAFLAAEALKNKAHELGSSIKIEIHEDDDIIDPLSDEEIAACKGIIVATDTSAILKRFVGKQVLVTTATKAISDPEKLIRTILENKAPITQAESIEKTNGDQKIKEKKKAGSDLLTKDMGMILSFIISGVILQIVTMCLSKNPVDHAFIYFKTLAEMTYELLYPLSAAYIAFVIAGINAVPAGLVGGLIGKAGYSLAWLSAQAVPLVSSGIFSFLIAGLSSAYIVKLLDKLFSGTSFADKFIMKIICSLLSIMLISTVMFAFNGPLSELDSNLLVSFNKAGINDQMIAILSFLISAAFIAIIRILLRNNKQ